MCVHGAAGLADESAHSSTALVRSVADLHLPRTVSGQQLEDPCHAGPVLAFAAV